MYRLMMVDDQRVIMEGIRQIMQSSDLPFGEFFIAENGDAALACIDSFKPDAIITDIRMPGMDGLTLADRVRARKDHYSAMPIIILSGYSDFEYAREAISKQVSNYMLKPVSKEELYAVFSQVCAQLDERIARKVSNFDLRRDILRAAINAEASEPAGEAGTHILVQFLPAAQNERFYSMMNSLMNAWKNEIYAAYERERDILLLLRGTCLPAIHVAYPAQLEINLSLPLDSLANLPAAFKQIQLVHLKRRVLYEQTVLSYSNIQNLDNTPPAVRLDDMRKLFDLICAGDAVRLRQQLTELNRQLFEKHDSTFESICAYYSALCMEVYKRYYNLKLHSVMQDEFGFLLHSASVLSQQPDVVSINAMVIDYICSLCRKLPSASDVSTVLAAKELVMHTPSYLLCSLADELHVSSQYLSALFHRETGQSFSSFLIEQRIIKAKALLEETDLPIIQISAEVGYTSEKHFYVMFKKNVGISPAKYRQVKRYENAKNSNNAIGGKLC